ncbi:MAG: lytic transglycosylase domain-containing protein [Muribaculaceae bacterium]|nr:lytic transglycosylase domain-containing protein [Muribaculaceae bacterium]
MKQSTQILSIFMLTCIGASCSAGAAQPEPGGTTTFSQTSETTPGNLTIVNPAIPASIKFADQNIELDRIDMYERFDRELTSMLYTHGNTLLLIKRANKYFPIIEPILKKNGVPTDLIYLACIESSLNQRAYSPAKAAGIWQFMPATAKQYGLEVNEWVDERYNIEKETEAACRYLKKAYGEYGNWESAAAAYNGGTNRITTQLDAQLADSAFDLYLVDETSRYMFRILAAKMILENPREFGFYLTPEQLYQPVEYDTVDVNTEIGDWAQWAQKHGITYSILREANPWIRAKNLPNRSGKTYKVKIPRQKSLYRSTQDVKVYNQAWVK